MNLYIESSALASYLLFYVAVVSPELNSVLQPFPKPAVRDFGQLNFLFLGFLVCKRRNNKDGTFSYGVIVKSVKYVLYRNLEQCKSYVLTYCCLVLQSEANQKALKWKELLLGNVKCRK